MTSNPEQTQDRADIPVRHGYFFQAWLVLAMALVFGSALAAVQVNLSGKIADNKLRETLAKVPDLVPGSGTAASRTEKDAALAITPGVITIDQGEKKVYYQLFKTASGQTLAGWVVKANGQGYAGDIELLLGLDPALTTITGLYILEQKETPGLGNKIAQAVWRDQFVGQGTGAPLTVGVGKGSEPNRIDAVTGATISSRSVTNIVNRTIGDLKGNLTPDRIEFSERAQ